VRTRFLKLDEILALHHDQIARYGGAAGIRDLSLLESAIGTPTVTWAGVFLHPTLPEMAAAYLFHIARNHPFVDGNKRTALMTALAFLWVNGEKIDASEDELVDLVVGVASGRVTKPEVAVFLANHGAKR
jgi:death on curing protein